MNIIPAVFLYLLSSIGSIILLGFRYLASSIPLISSAGVAIGVGLVSSILIFSFYLIIWKGHSIVGLANPLTEPALTRFIDKAVNSMNNYYCFISNSWMSKD